MKLHALIVSMALTVLVGAMAAAAQGTPRMGGVLKVASVGEPPTLDIAIWNSWLAP